MKSTTLAAAVVTLATALAAPAHADDPDIDFAHQLQTYGIYGARDYNAWLGKIVCERLRAGRDADAPASVRFIAPNLDRKTTQAQAWQFLGAAIVTYCPDQRGVYEMAAG
jgi:hypothetical protein